VWDILNERIVWEREGLDYGYGGYVDGGIYLSTRDYFSFHDYRGYELGTALYSALVDILPDGVFIYARPDEIGDRPAGIYRFTVPEGYKLLIEGATFIPYSFGPPRY
jgi:hypothetical protein